MFSFCFCFSFVTSVAVICGTVFFLREQLHDQLMLLFEWEPTYTRFNEEVGSSTSMSFRTIPTWVPHFLRANRLDVVHMYGQEQMKFRWT